MLRATSTLQTTLIQAKDGRFGSLIDVLFDALSWKVRWLVIDTGGWLTNRQVLVHPSALGAPDGSRDRLYVEMTKEQIRHSPGILQDPPVSTQMDGQFNGYNGWDGPAGYQGDMNYAIMLPPLFREGGSSDASRFFPGTARADPNLRSTNALAGYHIRAVDGDVGHIEEFLIDDEDWSVAYVIIDTKNWLPGSRVMLEPRTIVKIDWLSRQISLNVTCDQVKTSPPAWAPGETMPTEQKRK